MTTPDLEFPTHAARLQIFQPTRRPTWGAREVQNAWGWAKVSGRLGQIHLGLLEMVYAHAFERRMAGDLLCVIVDPAALKRGTGLNARQLEGLLEDLLDARVSASIFSRRVDVRESGLVSRVMRDAGRPTRRAGTLNADRARFWRIDFGLVWTDLLSLDLVTFTPPAVHKMRFGISQAVARFCLGHRQVSERFESLARRLGATRRADKLLAELEEDSGLLREAGIEILGGIVRKTPVVRPPNPGEPPVLSAKPRSKLILSIDANKASIGFAAFCGGEATSSPPSGAARFACKADTPPAPAQGKRR